MYFVFYIPYTFYDILIIVHTHTYTRTRARVYFILRVLKYYICILSCSNLFS